MDKGEITVGLVEELLAQQFPAFTGLPVRPVVLDGWDNTTFRLGEDMSVRLPSHERYVAQVDKEHRWLPVLAPQLPLPIPQPLAKGRPGCGFPRPWSIYGWLPGEPAALGGVEDHDRLADDLARFLRALQAVAPEPDARFGPHSHRRGGPVSVWDEQVRVSVEEVRGSIDDAGALGVWDAALGEGWAGPDRWVHGDVTGSNLLVRDGQLSGVIDFGCAAVGDPACDLTVAWTLFEGTSRRRFVDGVRLDPGTWARARGWALWKALLVLADQSDSARGGTRFGWRWGPASIIDELIDDHRWGHRGRPGEPGRSPS